MQGSKITNPPSKIMRILQIRFQNLNSLAGKWEIDLSHPAFISDGIFAVTGPTGAGKTTIFDAICLALYGQTPRLNKITKSENEIMSRQSGECFAEVLFETQIRRYRCYWSQHRARKQPGGELQTPRHEIADADSGKILASSIKEVAELVEEATGMDFGRFTRSMLLAQGDFAAFLQADSDERAPILEQITGTGIYSEISTRVHERQREEREKLELIKAETAGISILDSEKEREIGQALTIKHKEEEELAAQATAARNAIIWLTTIAGLKKEIGNLANEASKLESDIEDFRPIREKLDRASRAAALDSAYATLTATRKQQAHDRAALQTGKEALPGRESSAKEQAKALKLAEEQTVLAKEKLKTAAPILQKVRSLDEKLTEQKKAVLEGEEGYKKDAKKSESAQEARRKEQEKRANAYETLRLVDGYLKEHAQDEWLIGSLAGVEEQLSGLLSRQNEIVQKEADKEKATTALAMAAKLLDKCQKQSGIRKQELEGASKQLQQGKNASSQLLGDRSLREYRTEKETLLREIAFLTKIAELEEHRAKLEDGKPCPLCGATEHPFAAGNVPVPDETERKIDALTTLISKAEEQEAVIKKFEEAQSLARKNLMETEKQEAMAANDKNAAERALAEVKSGLLKLRDDFDKCKRDFSTKLQPLGITDIPDTGILSLLETLKERQKAWQTQFKKKAELEKQIADIDSEVKRLDAVIETQSTALAEKRERLEVLKKELAAGSEERNALYGDKNPDDEERRLNKAISDAESTEKQARYRNDKAQQEWNTAKGYIEALIKSLDQREPDLSKQESEFTAALAPAGFANEEEFLESRLATEQRNHLLAKGKELDERQTALKAKREDRETRLATELARKVTDKSLEEIELQLKEHEKALKERRDIIATLEHKLSENTTAKERLKEKQMAIDAREKECRRWKNLHELIGSADGKKYRNFAQGLTFEVMIGYANRQLQKMSNRYLLLRSDRKPLELNVIDNYQAGEIRSTKNLSGGESFIVSLSLALGLSHMASKKVRVDSLFLDEGFGALDDDALDTALETLAGLQQDGKLIGIISHIAAVKERIAVAISVKPLFGGRSSLSGPGCRELPISTSGQIG